MNIMMVGSAGETGAKLLGGEYRERLLARLTPSFLARLDDFGAQCAPKGKVCLVPVEEGGVYAALWKLAEAAGAGLTVEQQSIPVRQETIEICELLDVSPYLMRSGAYLYLTEKDEYGENQEYEKLSEESEDSEERSAWQKAVKIGTTNGSKDRVILGLEGRRYLNRPGMDEVERLRRELPPR